MYPLRGVCIIIVALLYLNETLLYSLFQLDLSAEFMFLSNHYL
jgi:hypothetical protein